MRIQSMVKKSIIIILTIVLMFSLISCIPKTTPLKEFLYKDTEYDYLVFEFSETSYAWIENIEKEKVEEFDRFYGEWIFDGKSIEIGAVQSNVTGHSINLYLREPYDRLVSISVDKVDKENKNAVGKAGYIYTSYVYEGMLEENQEALTIRKLSNEEWRDWMKDHSLDPDLYIPQQ